MDIKRVLFIIISVLLITGCTVKHNNFPGGNNNEDGKTIEENNSENGTTAEENNQSKEEPKEPLNQLEIQIENMTLEEKIGQILLVGMDGYDTDDNIVELMQSYHVGGIILYGKNVKDSKQLLSLINSLKNSNSSNKIPLFISVDEEGGSVSRNPREIKKLPTARSIGKTKDVGLAFKVGKLLGQTVGAFGYNMNFAPVLDIDSNPLNPVIGDRAFGQTAEIVSSMGIETLKGIKKEGVIPVVKHFPGHGDTAVDSHIGLPVVNHDLERIMNFEILPFKHAIDSGADAVMVAHILLSQMDQEYPASMSEIIITDTLRDKLNFQGVIITDDMTMGAIEKNYNIGDAAIQSVKAGADILLIGHEYEKSLTVLGAIKDEINKGNILMDRIDESVYRILKLKEKYNLKDSVIGDLNIEEINNRIDSLFGR
ncbi:MAG: beta-N-acetylhexosaminidase [Candidatus Alkaliphilus sp. MAG34]|nr:beta-N-acetylhexosaminidase [Clostridiales bacterium]